jgi:hypothetical protein
MKKIIFAIFAVLCMITISCQTEYPDSMEISGGNVSVENFPNTMQQFPAPAFVRLENKGASTFDLVFKYVPEAVEYKYFVKHIVVQQVRSLGTPNTIVWVGAAGSATDFSASFSTDLISNTTFNYTGTVTDWNNANLAFGIAAVSYNGTLSEITWSNTVVW